MIYDLNKLKIGDTFIIHIKNYNHSWFHWDHRHSAKFAIKTMSPEAIILQCSHCNKVGYVTRLKLLYYFSPIESTVAIKATPTQLAI